MSANQFLVIAYLFIWGGARIRGCFRRWQQPLLRGQEWFFNVRVQPDFYSGPGKKILHGYWMRMFIPFAVEVPMATAIFISGHVSYLTWLMLGMVAFVHVHHVFSVDLAERQARKLALPEAEEPVAAVVLSLKTRRVGDYNNRQVERFINLSTIIGIAWLVRYYLAAPDHHDLRVFEGPAVALYAQLGFLLAKYVVVAWRSPVPQVQAEEHIEAREAARKLYLKICDWNRIFCAGMLLLWPVLLKAAAVNKAQFSSVFLIVIMAISVGLGIWQEIKRKQVLRVALRARPVKLPEFLGHAEAPSWPLCYQPSAPMLVLKGARGYSINLANMLAQLSAAYLFGFGILMAVLRMKH